MPDDSGVAATETGRTRRWIPFWILQAAELAMAVVFVDISLHVDNGGLLVTGAVVFALLAVTAKGPLGLIRMVGPRLHVHLVEVAGIVIALAPVLPRFRPDIEGIIVAEFGAVGLIRLATLTSTVPTRRKPAVHGQVFEAAAATAAPTAAQASPADAPYAPGALGAATAKAARWTGRATGLATATGKRTVEAHRPEAEERVRKTIRGAGRMAGRATSPGPGPGPGPTPTPEPPER